MKLNVVIDASGIFYRSLFAIGIAGVEKNERLLDSKKNQGIFIRKLASDFSTLVSAIDEPSRVIVCLDSVSWRKSIPITDGGYKGKREKDETRVNWNVFYELTDKFADILKQKGYVVSRTPGAEGDDLLFFWSKRLNEMNENVILITGDGDMLQCVGLNENESWTIALDPINSRKKISMTQALLDYSKSEIEPVAADIFNPDTWSSPTDILNKLISSYDVNIVNKKQFCTKKIIVGDNGDSVPGVVTWPSTLSPGKISSISDSNYNKIVSVAPKLLDATWQDVRDGQFHEEIAQTMEELKKIKVDRNVLKDNIERNCKLVILSFETIPKQVHDSFMEHHVEIPDVKPVTGRDSLLNGTEWWSTNKSTYVPKAYDLF